MGLDFKRGSSLDSLKARALPEEMWQTERAVKLEAEKCV